MGSDAGHGSNRRRVASRRVGPRGAIPTSASCRMSARWVTALPNPPYGAESQMRASLSLGRGIEGEGSRRLLMGVGLRWRGVLGVGVAFR